MMNNGNDKKPGPVLTWGGLVLGLLVGALLGGSMYMSGSQLGRREHSHRAYCGASLNGIGKEIAIYQAEWDQMPPDLYSLVASGTSPGLFVCPSTDNDVPVINQPFDVDYQKKRVQFMADSSYIYIRSLDQQTLASLAMVFEVPANHYQEDANLLHADTSVSREQIPDMLAQLQTAFDYLRKKRDSVDPVNASQGSDSNDG
jgi:hypothetical protein